MVAKFSFDYEVPIIGTAIHNGHRLSPAFKQNLAITESTQLREEDPYTDYFIESLGNTVVAEFSRFEFDLNRPETRAIYQTPADAWGLKVRKNHFFDAHLSSAISKYNCFYSRFDEYLNKMRKKFLKILVLDIHSYNHRRQGPDAPYDNPEENPEVIIGTSNMNPKWLPIAENFKNSITNYDFMGRSLDARFNVKFPGGHFPRWINHRYGESVCCLAIEFKKIFMDEWTGERNLEIQTELKKALEFSIQNILEII